MQITIREPGSAITHFIGMLMAIFAAVPLLIRAAHEPGRIYVISLAIYAASLVLLYAASTTYHTFDLSEKINTVLKKIDHMMIFVLIAGSYTPICLLVLKGRTGLILLSLVWGIAMVGILDQGILGLLPQVGLFHPVYRNGLDLRACIYPDIELYVNGRFPVAIGWRNHLYGWRSDLCAEAAVIQQQTPVFRQPRDLPSVRNGRKRMHL